MDPNLCGEPETETRNGDGNRDGGKILNGDEGRGACPHSMDTYCHQCTLQEKIHFQHIIFNGH